MSIETILQKQKPIKMKSNFIDLKRKRIKTRIICVGEEAMKNVAGKGDEKKAVCTIIV
jgi:hypothetical protein